MEKARIVHEVNQMAVGGIEEVVRCIVKFDAQFDHAVVTYKNGPMTDILREAGAEVLLATEDVDVLGDLLHIHTGGGDSNLARQIRGQFPHLPIVETIHSPVKSPIPRTIVNEKVGVSEVVARVNNGIRIYNGLDFDRIRPTRIKSEVALELDLPPDVKVVGRIGRLGHDKDVEMWLLTIKELQDRGMDIVPVVVGDEAENAVGYRGRLKSMAESLPVHGVRWVNGTRNIGDYLQVFDCFLYPSPTEGFGLVFVEAMGAGVPIVTTNVEVNTEVTGGCAVLCNDDPKSLADGVVKLFENVTIKDKMIETAQVNVAEYFEAQRMSYEYQELYKRLLRQVPSITPDGESKTDPGQETVLNPGREVAPANT